MFCRKRLVRKRDRKTLIKNDTPNWISKSATIYYEWIFIISLYASHHLSRFTDNHHIFNRRIDDRSERKSIMTFNLRHTTCLRSIHLIMTYSPAVTIGYICSYTMICIKRVMITQWFYIYIYIYVFRSWIYKVLTLSSSILLLQKKVVIVSFD